MDRTEHVLGNGLHGDGVDVGVAEGLEDTFGIGAVRLVPGDLGSDLVRGQKNDPVSHFLDLPGPVVG